LGKENAFGEFEVVDVCTPGLPDPNPSPRMEIGKFKIDLAYALG